MFRKVKKCTLHCSFQNSLLTLSLGNTSQTVPSYSRKRDKVSSSGEKKMSGWFYGTRQKHRKIS